MKYLFECITSSQCYKLPRRCRHLHLYTDFTIDLYRSCTSAISQCTDQQRRILNYLHFLDSLIDCSFNKPSIKWTLHCMMIRSNLWRSCRLKSNPDREWTWLSTTSYIQIKMTTEQGRYARNTHRFVNVILKPLLEHFLHKRALFLFLFGSRMDHNEFNVLFLKFYTRQKSRAIWLWMVDRSIRYFPCTHLTCFIKLKELPHFVFTLTHFRMNINRFEKGTKRAPVTETEHRSAEELEKEGSATSTCQTPTRWRSSSVRSDLEMRTSPGSLSNTKVKKRTYFSTPGPVLWNVPETSFLVNHFHRINQ